MAARKRTVVLFAAKLLHLWLVSLATALVTDSVFSQFKGKKKLDSTLNLGADGRLLVNLNQAQGFHDRTLKPVVDDAHRHLTIPRFTD